MTDSTGGPAWRRAVYDAAHDMETRERQRVKLAMEDPNSVFVFGSNEAGRHGKGAARDAWMYYGAQYSKGVGHYGRSYALPTKDTLLRTLKVEEIARHVLNLRKYARLNPELRFIVTRFGCGLAGYTDAQMAILCIDMPPNCELPLQWQQELAAPPVPHSTPTAP